MAPDTPSFTISQFNYSIGVGFYGVRSKFFQKDSTFVLQEETIALDPFMILSFMQVEVYQVEKLSGSKLIIPTSFTNCNNTDE
jgi:hypothetical protein